MGLRAFIHVIALTLVVLSVRASALAVVGVVVSACCVIPWPTRRRRVAPMATDVAGADMEFARGWACLQQNSYVEAEAAFREVLEDRPDDADAILYLGIALAEQGRHAEAVPLFERAAGARPLDAEIHLRLGVSLGATGDVFRAGRALREALTLRPGLHAADEALAALVSAQRTAIARAQLPRRAGRRRQARYIRRTMPVSSQARQAGA